MIDTFVIVPLRDDESAVPVYTVSSPQFAYANLPDVEREAESVRLDDASRYQAVPMKFIDMGATATLW